MSLLQHGLSTSKKQPKSRKKKLSQPQQLDLPPQWQQEEEAPYVPHHLHRVVLYSRQGEKTLSESQMTVFRFVQVHFFIPPDFETSHKFGPLSGRSHEERVISAYMNGLLQIKAEFQHLRGSEDMKVCSTCGKSKHLPADCPEGF